MGSIISGYIQVYYTQNILENGIVFERRSFNKELFLSQKDFVYIPENFVKYCLPQLKSINIDNPAKINPINLKGRYFELGLLVESLEENQISTLLVSIMDSTESYYEINSIFNYFCMVKFDENQTSRICKMLIHCEYARKSFKAQQLMGAFLEKHKDMIEADLSNTIFKIYSNPTVRGFLNKPNAYLK